MEQVMVVGKGGGGYWGEVRQFQPGFLVICKPTARMEEHMQSLKRKVKIPTFLYKILLIINTKTLCEYTPHPCKILNVILAQDASDPFKIDVRRRKGNAKMEGRKVQVGVY